MKFKNKIMTAIVSICMLAFILPMAVSAADNADSSDKNTITCYVRAEQDDGTILPYTKVTRTKTRYRLSNPTRLKMHRMMRIISHRFISYFRH